MSCVTLPCRGIFINGCRILSQVVLRVAADTGRVAFQGARRGQDWKYNPSIQYDSHGDNNDNQKANDAINGNELNPNCSTPNRECHQRFCRKSRRDCPWPSMTDRWDVTDKVHQRWRPDDRFGFLFSFLLHFFCIILKVRETKLLNYGSTRGSVGNNIIQISQESRIFATLPNCLSVIVVIWSFLSRQTAATNIDGKYSVAYFYNKFSHFLFLCKLFKKLFLVLMHFFEYLRRTGPHTWKPRPYSWSWDEKTLTICWNYSVFIPYNLFTN